MYADLTRFDFSLIVIWFVAVVTVFLGALWTRYEFVKTLTPKKTVLRLNSNNVLSYQVQTNQTTSESSTANNSGVDSTTDQLTPRASKTAQKDSSKDENVTIQIGYVSILVLLVFVVGMLLLLYFFYNVMSKTYFKLIT